jgi:hypothetical protein
VKRQKLKEDIRGDFGVIQTATLTMLGLIIGFTFSMAISRYEQRKNYEEAEANAIGTEYVRADLLPGGDAARVRVRSPKRFSFVMVGAGSCLGPFGNCWVGCACCPPSRSAASVRVPPPSACSRSVTSPYLSHLPKHCHRPSGKTVKLSPFCSW